MNMFRGFCMSQRNFVLLRDCPRFLKNVLQINLIFLLAALLSRPTCPSTQLKKLELKKNLFVIFFSSEAIIVPSDVTIKSKI